MTTTTKAVLLVGGLVAVGAGVWLAAALRPLPRAAIGKETLALSGGLFQGGANRFTGCGWSIHAESARAAKEALGRSLGDGQREPDVTFVFYTTHHKPEAVAAALRGVPGSARRVCGWTSHQGVLTSEGFHASPDGAIGVLSLRLPGIRAGVGGAAYEEAETPGAAAKLALRRAVQDAGVSDGEVPTMIVLGVSIGREEDVLKALAEAAPSVPVIGGSAAGSLDWVNREALSNWSVIANDRVIINGLSLAVFYSPEPFAWTYEGGYDLGSASGTVTDCERRLIKTIDGRPASQVYSEWLGGRLSGVEQTDVHLLTFTALYPVCRRLSVGDKVHNNFVHVWPSVAPDKAGYLITASDVAAGEKVHVSEGTWNILINRFGALPRKAMETRPGMNVGAGLFVCCGCILDNIPPESRDQVAYLLKESLGNRPWVAMFTWGEQGNVPGLGNFHGNLTTSALLFPGGAGETR